MAFLKRSLRLILARAEAALDWSFGQRNNPLVNLGQLSWLLFLIIVASGVVLLVPVSHGYAGSVARGLHSYAGGALCVAVLLHLLREFSLDRMRAQRTFAWITGVMLLLFVSVGGITAASPLLLHIASPLVIIFLVWLHVQRRTRARVRPPMALAIATTTGLLALSFAWPDGGRQLASLGAFGSDAAWFVVVPVVMILSALPWLPPAEKSWLPVVSLNNCNGCGRCLEDCPFDAISMVPRTDGKPFELEASVHEDRCVSCGICAGSCPTSLPFRRTSAAIPGIELPDRTMADLREKTFDAANSFDDGQRVLVYACDHCGADALEETHARVVRLPCVGMLPPAFIDFALSRDLADGVMVAGCAENDCYYRLGDTWTNQRIDGERDPMLRQRVDRDRLETSWLPAASRKRRLRDLDDFTAWLEQLPRAAE
ncbi:MAG: hydrogenase iron-sulfur subunit [Woeseiaceae bacterium]|jgi:ferredoxin